MNKKYNSMAILGLAAMAAISLANSGGSPGGRSGSEVDGGKTCATMGGCHAGGGDILTQDMITTDIPASGYKPGESYTITLSPAFEGAGRYGFEMMAQDETPTAVGTWGSNDDGNAQSSGARVSHKFASIGGGDTKTWELDWTAPEAGTGDVEFFASVLAANNNGNTGGDRLIVGTLTVSENEQASVADILNADITLYPNPVVNTLHIKGLANKRATVQVVDLNGKTVQEEEYTGSSVDVAHLPSGAYQLKLAIGDLVINKKFVKR